MFTRLFTITILAVVITVAGPAWSYDSVMAESYAELFAPVKGAGAGKALHLMKPDVFLNKVKTKELLVAVALPITMWLARDAPSGFKAG